HRGPCAARERGRVAPCGRAGRADQLRPAEPGGVPGARARRGRGGSPGRRRAPRAHAGARRRAGRERAGRLRGSRQAGEPGDHGWRSLPCRHADPFRVRGGAALRCEPRTGPDRGGGWRMSCEGSFSRLVAATAAATRRARRAALAALAALAAGAAGPGLAAAQDLAVRGATILTISDGVIADGTVVIRGGRITAVGPRASVRIPSGVRVIDGTGLYVMPGIVDAHSHMAMDGGRNERTDP